MQISKFLKLNHLFLQFFSKYIQIIFPTLSCRILMLSDLKSQNSMQFLLYLDLRSQSMKQYTVFTALTFERKRVLVARSVLTFFKYFIVI